LRTRHLLPLLLPALALPHGCMPSSSTTPNLGIGVRPELVFCRTNVARTHRDSTIVLRSAQNLGTARLADRTGRERHVRAHPDARLVVFAREHDIDDETSRELHVAAIDGSRPELRLTTNNVADDQPCWSPTGESVLFATARDGDRRLYVCAADGSNPQPFLLPPAGAEDRDPSWCPATDRVVFARRDATGVRRLYIADGDGGGAVPLTVGAPAPTGDSDGGDRYGTFSPDGGQIAFVRFSAPGRARLLVVDLQSGAVQQLLDPGGVVRLPRWSPQGDRVFFGLEQPLQGRAGLRLAALNLGGSTPLLVEPGEQWLCDGLDVFKDLPPLPPALAPLAVDVADAEIQIASGARVQGDSRSLRNADGDVLALATATFDGNEVAAINCRVTLPIARPDDLLEAHVQVIARITRADAGSALRSSMHNPVAERFDTVVELANPGTGMRTFAFSTQSLAHVTNERQLRFTVVGEIAPGAAAELQVDQVQLTIVRRADR
jgi:dipeptidyl aminopeptidase/acylaminoacyl peptidase